jgi:hypothetical protein
MSNSERARRLADELLSLDTRMLDPARSAYGGGGGGGRYSEDEDGSDLAKFYRAHRILILCIGGAIAITGVACLGYRIYASGKTRTP